MSLDVIYNLMSQHWIILRICWNICILYSEEYTDKYSYSECYFREFTELTKLFLWNPRFEPFQKLNPKESLITQPVPMSVLFKDGISQCSFGQKYLSDSLMWMKGSCLGVLYKEQCKVCYKVTGQHKGRARWWNSHFFPKDNIHLLTASTLRICSFIYFF